jgi:hypothetical protein
VALLLLWLGAKPASRARWAPALEILPSRDDFEAEGGSLRMWSVDELRELHCPTLEAAATALRERLRTEYDEVVVPGWAHLGADAPPCPSLSQFEWATCVVSSRCYDGEAPGISQLLIPAVDLCNHAPPGAASAAKLLAPWAHFVVVAARNLKPGAEVTLCYGDLPDSRLLTQFGFVLGQGHPQDAQLASEASEAGALADAALAEADGLLDGEEKPRRRLAAAFRRGLRLSLESAE